MTRQTWHTWRWPARIGLLTAAGLAGGLVSEGWGDVLAWVSLAVPCCLGLRGLLAR